MKALSRLKTGGASARQEGKTTPMRIVTGEPFCLDKVMVDKKDIVEYIKGKATPLLGPDFYYCYIYDGAMLAFVAFQSDSHQVGAVHLLTKALVAEGKYCAPMAGGSTFYYITNDAHGINVEIDYSQREGYEMLDAPLVHRDIQRFVEKHDTLRARWSLEKTTFNLNALLLAVFAIMLAASLAVSWKYKSAKVAVQAERARQLAKPVVAPPPKEVKLPNLVTVIATVGDEVDGKGVIEKALLVGNGMQFTVSFKSEQAAQSFIRQFGGKYEQGKVVYTAPLSSNR